MQLIDTIVGLLPRLAENNARKRNDTLGNVKVH